MPKRAEINPLKKTLIKHLRSILFMPALAGIHCKAIGKSVHITFMLDSKIK